MSRRGLASQETTTLVACMETTIMLCRHTMRHLESSYQKIKESAQVVAGFDELQTMRQIQKTAKVITRFNHLDTLEKQAQSLLKTYCT